jgi:4-amino-4-deoxy-L-arabinose transferase-like glycosyltransferase
VLREGKNKNRQLLGLILAAAVLIRIPVALLMGNEISTLPGIHDQVSYDALARSLLAGRGYSFTENWYPFTPADTPTAHWSFLYPLYLAGVYAVTGYHPLFARLLQGTLGAALLCYLVYKIGCRVINEKTGLVGAGLAAVYGYFIYYNVALMTETFFIVLVLLTLYLSIEIKDHPTPANWVRLGLSLGLACLLRQTILLFVPFLLLWLFLELRGRSIRLWHFTLPVIIIVLLISPWTIRNYFVYGEFLLLNSNAGYALFASNHPNLGRQWDNRVVVVPVPEDLAGQNEAQIDRALTQKGLQFILADPSRYVWLTLSKPLEYFKFGPSSESGWISNLVRMLSYGLYLPFMLWGLYLSMPRWRNFVVLYLFIFIHSSIHLLSWPAPRYRLPVDAVSMLFAAMSAVALAKQLRVWGHRKLASAKVQAEISKPT